MTFSRLTALLPNRIQVSRPCRRSLCVQAAAASQRSNSNMTKPTLFYWPLRGRAEVIRMLLTVAGQEYDEVQPDYTEMKNSLELYPFGQCPGYQDSEIRLVQSNTIIRYLAKKHHLNGADDHQQFTIDMVMEGIESLRTKYLALVYQDALAEEAKAKWWQTHGDKSSSNSRNNGAHLMYLSHFLEKNEKNHKAYVVGDKISAGDLALYDITELVARIFPEEMKTEYPSLMAHHARLNEMTPVKEYFETKRCSKVNGNDLG